eukprot:CAMPEP_0197413826 /NCGR_PEP_ID=MMETSP1170-20131217/644_1 /TAXON_ID=54406 /ORGANISM="Sarcinochrysis sp, Strain CCMP770" /LENGTH=251 /DNA_ID=CAMNT_0042940469 /DNA_START=24 /DNA_END=780 /DNA_ORIENTATION=+
MAVVVSAAAADLEAVVREAAMASPEWWEAHHQLGRLRAGTSWFAPISRRVVGLVDRRRCGKEGQLAYVLGCGYSRTVDWLAGTGSFGRVVGVDASPTAIATMRAARTFRTSRFSLGHVQHVPPNRTAGLVVDEGLLDLNRRTSAAAWRLVAPGGALAVVGYAGRPGLVVNDSALDGAPVFCLSRTQGLVPLDALQDHPALACSPWRAGAYVAFRPTMGPAADDEGGSAAAPASADDDDDAPPENDDDEEED